MPLPERIANSVPWRDDRPRWKRDLIDLPRDYAAYFHNRNLFADVEAFCLFIGDSRSGHSLLGSLINAHRRAVVIHELDALRQVEFGYRRRALYGAILRQDRQFASLGRRWTGTSPRPTTPSSASSTTPSRSRRTTRRSSDAATPSCAA